MGRLPVYGRENVILGDINDITGTITDKGSKTNPFAIRLTDGTDFYVAAKDSQLPSSLTASGNLKVAILESLPAGTNNIGKVDVNSLPSIPAGSNLIGSVDINSMPSVDVNSLPSLPAGTNKIGSVDIASALPAGSNLIGKVDINSAIPAGTNIIGAVKKDKINYTIVNKHVSSSDATGGVTVWDPTAGTKWVVTDLIISTDTAMTVTVKDGTTAILVLYLAANGGMVSNFQTPLESSAADNNLTVTASAAGNIAVTATGYEI